LLRWASRSGARCASQIVAKTYAPDNSYAVIDREPIS
jgi:hypothetical protein